MIVIYGIDTKIPVAVLVVTGAYIATTKSRARRPVFLVRRLRRIGGGGGIRTHGDLRLTRFPSVPIRPLSHPSKVCKSLMRRRIEATAVGHEQVGRYRQRHLCEAQFTSLRQVR